MNILKQIFDYAEREGAIMHNPAAHIKRMKIVYPEPVIPTRDQFTRLVVALHSSGNADAADFVELLGYSGMRRNEAASLTWSDVDFDRGTFRVTGGEYGTKNREHRRVPLFPSLREFLLRIRQQRDAQAQPETTVMKIAQCRDGIGLACKQAGLPHFSHHDMWHFFTSNACEQGIDFKVIASWLGHKDGGLLVAKIYSHVREQHSQSMAERMTFTANAPPANVVPVTAAANA